MNVKDLVDATIASIPVIASMPVRVDTLDNKTLIYVFYLFMAGECMLPNKILNMEVRDVSLFQEENEEDMGLLINVEY